MLRRTNYGIWVDNDGKPNKNELAIDYIVESARSVGIEVIEGKTALDIQFMAEVMKRLKEKQEPCEDCISRAEAIKAFNLSEKTRKYGGDHSGYDTMMLYEIQDVLEDLPSVQPKPMQVDLEGDGYSDGQLVYDYGKCPKCGWDFEYGDKDWEEPYCCHCGQKLHWFESEDGE